MPQKVNNKHLDIKIDMREKNLPSKKEIHVLDAFCGEGLIWKGVTEKRPDITFKITGIDIKKYEKSVTRTVIHGNNMKFMRSVDLNKYDVIDLDTYGVPIDQLEIIREKNWKGRLFITFNFMMSMPLKMMLALGYTEGMYRKIPTLISRNGFEKFQQYLALMGCKEIFYYELAHGRYYITLELK